MKLVNAVLDFDGSITNYKQITYTIRVPSAANYPEDSASKTRYTVRLSVAPYLNDLVTYPITVGALTRVTTSPAFGQFRVVDSINQPRPHIIEFNSAQAGNTYTVTFYALATVLDHNQIGCITSGYDPSYPVYVLNESDHPDLYKATLDLPSGNKIVYVKNGDYTISDTINFQTLNITEFIGESTTGVRITCTVSSKNHIYIHESIAKNFTLTSTVSASYGAVVGATNKEHSGKVQNVHLISSGSTGYGFSECSNLSGCYATLFDYGFNACKYVTQSHAYDNVNYGFISSSFLSNCYSSSNGIGFSSSTDIQNCYALQSTTIGFQTCTRVYHCSSLANTTYGFSNCLSLSGNYALNNTTQNYNQTGGALCYASRVANATYVIAANGTDTANGGFNV